MFGPPFTVVAVARIVFRPATNGTVNVASCQVVHAPVPGKLTATGAPPLTLMSSGRLVVVPFANRNVSAVLPGDAAATANSTYPPTALS